MIKGAVMNEHKKHGSSFSSKMGFILAAAGSAVGLGNLWRFPYLAAKYGGGSFLLIYVILAVTFGFALMITEIALGRKTGKSALYAFSTLHEKCGFIGILASIVPIIILPYYCVIGGWVIKFAWAFLTGSGNAAAADDYFSNFIARTGEPVMWLVFFILATSVVILLGVNKGIENISKVLMPLRSRLHCRCVALWGSIARPRHSPKSPSNYEGSVIGKHLLASRRDSAYSSFSQLFRNIQFREKRVTYCGVEQSGSSPGS